MIRGCISLALGILSFSIVHAQEYGVERSIQGKVFIDRNENGLQDKNERGLKDILISNGVDFVKTNAKGEFSICAKIGQSIFPILPSDYGLVSPKQSSVVNGLFYYLSPQKQSDQIISFALKKQHVPTIFKIGAIGDVQVENAEELTYASKSIFSELMNRKDINFNIFLGDLVNNVPELLDDVKNVIEELPQSSWTLVGNHDRNVSNQDALNDVFNDNFGADNYAFNYGNRHFIVLNNVFATGKHAYEGRISDEQLQFIKNDLSYVNKSTPIIISQHIPMMGVKNREMVFDLLKDYENVLILSGHTHVVTRHIFKNGQIHELGAGATCGTWWRGEKDSEGVPEALMHCGAPRGYFTVEFGKDTYDIKFKAVGMDTAKQMALTLDSNSFVANIYAGSDSSKVFIQVDNGEWLPMKKERKAAPQVVDIIAKNKNKVYPTANNTVNPLRVRNSSHIWTSPLTRNDKVKQTVIRIKASDNYGLDIQQEFVIGL